MANPPNPIVVYPGNDLLFTHCDQTYRCSFQCPKENNHCPVCGLAISPYRDGTCDPVPPPTLEEKLGADGIAMLTQIKADPVRKAAVLAITPIDPDIVAFLNAP